MDILCCALALLGGVIGAGFASGREIVRFFAQHGAMGFAAVFSALAVLFALFLLLPERLLSGGQTGLSGLCAARRTESGGPSGRKSASPAGSRSRRRSKAGISTQSEPPMSAKPRASNAAKSAASSSVAKKPSP